MPYASLNCGWSLVAPIGCSVQLQVLRFAVNPIFPTSAALLVTDMATARDGPPAKQLPLSWSQPSPARPRAAERPSLVAPPTQPTLPRLAPPFRRALPSSRWQALPRRRPASAAARRACCRPASRRPSPAPSASPCSTPTRSTPLWWLSVLWCSTGRRASEPPGRWSAALRCGQARALWGGPVAGRGPGAGSERVCKPAAGGRRGWPGFAWALVAWAGLAPWCCLLPSDLPCAPPATRVAGSRRPPPALPPMSRPPPP